MAIQSVNEVTVNLPGDVNDDGEGDISDCFIFSTSLSARGSSKRDEISVENYDRERKLRRLWMCTPHTPIKSESPIYIDLDQYNNEDDNDDDLKILYFAPPNLIKSLEKGESSSLRKANFECQICVESKCISESFRISGCSHFYCNDCVSKYIAAKLQDNILSIDCPVSGCSGGLDPDQCRQILPIEVFNRWGDALCEALVMRSSKFYCPYKDCSALVFLDESETTMKESECPHCHRMVCVKCETKWHPEITCEEFQKLAENEREKDDILLKNMAQSKQWKRCPSCKFYIERSQGCLYMKCRCGFAFCYNCETPSKDTTHYCHNCKR